MGNGEKLKGMDAGEANKDLGGNRGEGLRARRSNDEEATGVGLNAGRGLRIGGAAM